MRKSANGANRLGVTSSAGFLRTFWDNLWSLSLGPNGNTGLGKIEIDLKLLYGH